MPKVLSDKPLFVDLFYGVVVGSAVASLSLAAMDRLVFQILWIIAVLEDWFLYYRHIVDPEHKRVVYSLRSLVIEFAILLTWFLGFQALKEDGQEGWFLLFFCLFYGVKVLAGVTFYAKHGQLLSRRMAYDSMWLVQIGAAVWLWYKGVSFGPAFWTIAGVTSLVLATWWLLMRYRPPEGA